METQEGSIRRLIRSLGDLGRDAKGFGRALGSQGRGLGQLMIVGTPSYEPWHFTAHLADEAARWGRPDLSPTLMRWRIPEGAPGHLAVSVDQIAHASRSATVLVIPDRDDQELIERVSDAHRRGARVMSIERACSGLTAYSHEHLTVDVQRSDHEYDISQHIVTAIAPMR